MDNDMRTFKTGLLSRHYIRRALRTQIKADTRRLSTLVSSDKIIDCEMAIEETTEFLERLEQFDRLPKSTYESRG